MSLIIRPPRADELAGAEALVARSINDLTERHGFGAIATLRPPDFQLFSLQDDPDGLWVAEVDGEIVGFALSWVCGSLWFLAELFVSPGLQSRGVGKELLERTFEHARESRCHQQRPHHLPIQRRIARTLYSSWTSSAAANLFG